MTRPPLEFTVRKRLGGYRNIELRESCRAQEFIPAPDEAGVAAVRCQNSDGGSETLPAVLVIDASGHGSFTLALLQAIGWPVPQETSIGVDMGYATALFDIPEGPVPLRGTPLTLLRLAEVEVCFEPHKKTLGDADDVIHGT
jgi:hypothetical protein